MRNVSGFLFLIVVTIAISGCRSLKSAGNSAEADMLHRQAREAIEARRFFIEGREFRFSDSPEVKTSLAILTLDGWKARLEYSPGLVPGFYSERHFILTGDSSEITKVRKKRNGNIEYTLMMKGDRSFLERRILIELVEHSNECIVTVFKEVYRNSFVNFKGTLYTL